MWCTNAGRNSELRGRAPRCQEKEPRPWPGLLSLLDEARAYGVAGSWKTTWRMVTVGVKFDWSHFFDSVVIFPISLTLSPGRRSVSSIVPVGGWSVTMNFAFAW